MNEYEKKLIAEASEAAAQVINHQLYDVKNTYSSYKRMLRAVCSSREKRQYHTEMIDTLIDGDVPLSQEVQDDLADIILDELHQTLLTNSLPRIRAIGIRFVRPSNPFNWYDWRNIILHIMDNPPVWGIISGEQDAGKSCFSVMLTDLLTRGKEGLGITVCTNLWIHEGSMNATQRPRVKLVTKASEIMDTPGKVLILLDESHLFWSKWTLQTKRDEMISHWLKLVRKFGHTPILITNSLRKLPNYYTDDINLKFIKTSRSKMKVVHKDFTQHIHGIPREITKYNSLTFDTNKVRDFTIDLTMTKMLQLLNQE